MALKMTALATFALAAIVSVILGCAPRRWMFGTEQLRAKFDATRRPISTKTYDPSELIGLPEPVQRYFRATLCAGQQIVAAVNMSEMALEFRSRRCGRTHDAIKGREHPRS